MTRPKKILDLRDSPWVDGPGRTVLDTASALDLGRCELIIGAFCSGKNDDSAYVVEARRRGLNIAPIIESRSFDFRLIGQVLGAINTYSINIIHTHDFRSNLVGLVCAKRVGIPIISTCHGWIENDFKGRTYAKIDRYLLRFFDRVITVSAATKAKLLASSFPETKIEVIPNALVLSNFEPHPEDQSFREELGIRRSTMVISNIGRLSPEKGQSQLISVASTIAKRYPDVCFVVVGIGGEEEVLRRQVSDSGLSNYVRFAGYRSDMQSVYNSSDLIVQCSVTEGMPNVILEALLMGVPVVATDVGGTREIIENGRTGRLIEPKSAKQLIDGICAFLDDPERHNAMAQCGRKLVMASFDHSARVEQITRTYESFASSEST